MCTFSVPQVALHSRAQAPNARDPRCSSARPRRASSTFRALDPQLAAPCPSAYRVPHQRPSSLCPRPHRWPRVKAANPGRWREDLGHPQQPAHPPPHLPSARRAPHRLPGRHPSPVRLRQRPRGPHRVVSSARAHPRNPRALPAPHARPARRVPCPALGHPPRSSRGPVAQDLLDDPPSLSWPRNPARMCRHPPLPGDPRTPSSSKRTPRQPLPCCSQNRFPNQESGPSSQAPWTQVPHRSPKSSMSCLGRTLLRAIHPSTPEIRARIPEKPLFSSRSSKQAPGKTPYPSPSGPNPGALLTLPEYLPAQQIFLPARLEPSQQNAPLSCPNGLLPAEPPNSSRPNSLSSCHFMLFPAALMLSLQPRLLSRPSQSPPKSSYRPLYLFWCTPDLPPP